MDITVDRLKHSKGVATKMKEMALNEPSKYPFDPDSMYVLGMLHDIGYEFSEKQEQHANRGGEVLKAQNYKYWKEVYYHGIAQTEYDSPELRLLNNVDMTTDPTGKYMTIQERIDDIAARYGKGSWQEKEAIELARMLEWG